MRVAQVVGHLEPGGALNVARDLGQAFRTNGAEATLIALRDHPAGVPAAGECVLSPPHRSALLGTIQTFLSMLRQLRAVRPDAVVAHTPKAAAIANLAAILTRVPRRVVVEHAPAYRLGRLTRALDVVCTRLGVHTDVVFVGSAVRSTFLAKTGRAYSGSIVIRNGVRPTADRSTAADITEAADGTFRVLAVARVVEDKNLSLLVPAFAALRGRATLQVAGDGPLRNVLQARAEAVGSPVEFVGNQEPGAVQRLYAAADALVFPSRTEALPLVLLEAAQHGLPVVAADHPANREVLGDAAVYVASDDPADWSRAIERLAGDPGLRRRVGEMLRARSVEFDHSVMVQRYWQLLSGAQPA
jgi:glycosyltransferase involved in cell wall biosynthesis